MEYPFGHHHHSHHRRDDDSNEFPPPPPFSQTPPYPPPPGNFPNYPPPSYGGAYGDAPPPPPPAHVTSVYHHQPPHLESQNYPPPPRPQASDEGPHFPHFRPHMPSFMEGHFHGGGGHSSSPYGNQSESEGGYGYGPQSGGDLGILLNKQSYKVYSKAGGHQYSIAIRDRKVVLTHSDPNDPTQHWVKDEKYSTKVKDAEGYPSFVLVNKATGQALKHSVSGHPVQLVPYKPDVFDESVLWTESKDFGGGFRTIRMVNNVRLVMDAFNGDKDHGGVHDGTVVALYEVWKGDNQNQQWKIVPY